MANSSELRYDFWDILKAPRLALSGKKLLAQAGPLWIGYLAYLILTYVAEVSNGESLADAWARSTFFPCINFSSPLWYSTTLWILGVVILIACLDFGNLKAAKLMFEELRGNYFYSAKAAAKDAFSNLLPLWVSAALIILLVVALALVQAVLGLLGLIPGIGPILYAVLYALPFLLWSLFLVFLVFGLTTAIFTLPAIIVAREKETFGATFYIYNIIWSQPLHWLGMTAVGLAFAKLGVWILGYFFMRALQLTNYLTSLFTGGRLRDILTAAYNMLEPGRPFVDFMTTLYPGSSIRYDWIHFPGQVVLSGSDQIAAIIIAICTVALLIVILSYGINIVTSSQLLAFLIIHYREDRIKLTEDPSRHEREPNEIVPDKPKNGGIAAP